MALKKVPIGIENFEKIRTQDFYYVDKTGFLVELLQNWGEVNLFTRPRRFGKSLNMNMLQSFLQIGCKKELFDGLKISQEQELCEKYMGQFPVVSVTLKGVNGLTYQRASDALKNVIGKEALRFQFLKEDENISIDDKEQYQALITLKDGMFTMTETVLESSLQTLCELLSKHYNRKVILLIDEYDVPLDKAFQAGYYTEMVSLIRNLFDHALKSNDYLQFAVLTGCLRISKESIFTGLNNLNVMSITDEYFSDSFGFTEQEVQQMLKYYDCVAALDTMRDWYDGYRFGESNIYCPWDVIKYCQALIRNKNAEPEDYWANTSGNDLVRRFVDKADQQTKEDIEKLMDGCMVTKKINQELTYRELDGTIDNLWSVLFMTGYLTQRGREEGKRYRLAIPNKEIRDLFVYQIHAWFNDKSSEDAHKLDAFCEAFPAGDAETIENLFNDYLWNTISIRDTATQKDRKENFYHGILLGLLGHKGNWSVRSNAESGEGYSDILVRVPDGRIGVVIEVKYAENNQLESSCEEALHQIEEKQYDADLLSDGMKTIVKYGIACYKKHCRVVRG